MRHFLVIAFTIPLLVLATPKPKPTDFSAQGINCKIITPSHGWFGKSNVNCQCPGQVPPCDLWYDNYPAGNSVCGARGTGCVGIGGIW
ncbi:hypothetical protein BU23DRAFT_555041 [Bimuria novae-zelandiae CBS 107.79]|uniref:CBM1 domain-containing protein n=1 Tax=Bimuria novae-zelandiae CBS 107.79 TaxID=1447943 RepID=A0A6A5V908_9PLEO|nr:hypothetical protein BU23DRAFT_555041 [Bimuria novae-zelandiae CBS 107.79]